MANKFKVGEQYIVGRAGICDGLSVILITGYDGDWILYDTIKGVPEGTMHKFMEGSFFASRLSKLNGTNNHKILITTDGTTTTATLFDGKQKVKTAEAKCAPDDTFSFETGAKLAFDRLMGREDKATPRKDKPLFDWDAFKAGKIAVHCDTEEKAHAFFEECIKHGINRWSSGDSLIKYTNWFRYDSKTSYGFNYGGLTFGDGTDNIMPRKHCVYPFSDKSK